VKLVSLTLVYKPSEVYYKCVQKGKLATLGELKHFERCQDLYIYIYIVLPDCEARGDLTTMLFSLLRPICFQRTISHASDGMSTHMRGSEIFNPIK